MIQLLPEAIIAALAIWALLLGRGCLVLLEELETEIELVRQSIYKRDTIWTERIQKLEAKENA